MHCCNIFGDPVPNMNDKRSRYVYFIQYYLSLSSCETMSRPPSTDIPTTAPPVASPAGPSIDGL